MMKAIVQDTYGPPAILALREVEKPHPKEDEVLVRVRAAGVNPGDLVTLRGEPRMVRLFMGLQRPGNGIIGMDLAGTVTAVGGKVNGLRPGDEVFGVGRSVYAEYAVAKAKDVVGKPSNITFVQAAAIPTAGLTALQALVAQAQLQAGQRVLVTGAGGGVGTHAVQIAKALGAHVTALCGPEKVELVRSLGADRVLDRSREDIGADTQRYDVILDNGGRHSLRQLRQRLSPRGTLIPNNGEFHKRWIGSLGSVLGARLLSLFIRQRLRPFLSLPNSVDLHTLARMLEKGQIVPTIERTYPLAETAQALAHIADGQARGKVVITLP